MQAAAFALGAYLMIQAAPPVPTPKGPVVDELFGHKIPDPYRWLEDAKDPAVVAWTEKQNAHMRKVLDAVPGRKAIEARLWELHEIGTISVPQVKGEGEERRYFYTRREGKQNQPVLYVRKGQAGPDEVLVDVNALAKDGTRALDWWYASEDGKRVAYGVSEGGDEKSVLHVRDVATGKDLPDVISRARAASVAWLPDSSGFYYTRYPRPGSVPKGEEEYHRHVFFHRLGSDPDGDAKVFGQGRNMTDWPSVKLSPNGRWLGIEVSQGWAKTEIFLIDRQPEGGDKPAEPVTVVAGVPAIYNLAEVEDDRLLLVSNEKAPRYRVFAVPVTNPVRKRWKVLIPQRAETLENIASVGGKIVALYLKDAASRLRLYTATGRPVREIDLPGLGTTDQLGGQLAGSELFFNYTSYLTPTVIFRQDLAETRSTVWQRLPSPIDEDRFEVRQVRYRSKDGTRVPMFLVHKKGLEHDGHNPVLLYGYGGFNISLTPRFAAQFAPFIEAGGVYAVANLRGGAEYGEAWHKAGMLGKKQNVFDDFIAAAEYLVRRKITSPERLAISGRSNGGLLTTAVLTQRPDLYRAVISGVPLTDMLRYHLFRIAKLWIPEYGSPEEPKAFKWLYAYSPYHRVKQGAKYPAVFVFTAESDSRVDAMHARKMVAALQAATASSHPILLRLESQAGHGAGKPLAKIIAQYTDEMAFLFGQLNMAVLSP